MASGTMAKPTDAEQNALAFEAFVGSPVSMGCFSPLGAEQDYGCKSIVTVSMDRINLVQAVIA